ncbi:MAG: T9SS type A sorting domain-containing protein [Saprospiraceae bacterium]|nr:T9SS type A sorting domain-containing protein [Candidatus Vicinibacter affinis]
MDQNNNTREVDLLNTSSVNITKDQFLIYPNPVSQLLHIKSDAAFSEWKIMDLNGKILSKSGERFFDDSAEIQTYDLQSGIYLIELNFPTGKEE